MSLIVNAYCTHRTPPGLNFQHEMNSARDRSDPELAEHLDGFVGYVVTGGGTGPAEMTAMRYAVMRHLQRVQHQFSFNVADESVLDQMEPWARASNAILFLPDGNVYDPSGYTLVARGGDPDIEAQVPFPQNALERKARTERHLAKIGLQPAATLPPVISEVEVEFRSPQEVALRALALVLVAVQGEGHNTGDPIPLAEMKQRMPLGFQALSPNEAEFMNNPNPPQQDIINAAWRYEALFVLEWALGLVKDFHMPTAICDVPLVAGTLLNADAEQIVANAQLRSPKKLLDALDAHFRLHWIARQAGLDGSEVPGNLDAGVLNERHHALNWLIRFEDAEWDQVDTPT